jgi:hypothetical protein
MRLVSIAIFFLLSNLSCTASSVHNDSREPFFDQTVALVAEVKEFGRTISIEPSEALRKTSLAKTTNSILWLWFQKLGTLALQTPIDIRTSVTFLEPKGQVPLNQLYHFGKYSVYLRQADEFGDSISVITPDFVKESVLRKVELVLHEDLHDDKNFALIWEYEESLVNAIGLLATIDFFNAKGDENNAQQALQLLEERRRVSRDISALTLDAVNLFRLFNLENARKNVFDRLSSYPTYKRYYENDLNDLETIMAHSSDKNFAKMLALEAKISHDFVYYRYFDRIVKLREKIGSLKTLVEELKQVNKRIGKFDVTAWYIESGPFQSYGDIVDKYLVELEKKYEDCLR